MVEPAQKDPQKQSATAKSPHALREEAILAHWKEQGIFDKTLAKSSPEGEFVFYEGPPTANGRPGIHHLEARAFKDAIPRYKTMRGYHVRRKGGWDTHGLPVELLVEKQLGLKSKKEIESYGIAAFNEKCKESVWTYVHEWEDFTNRMGYWVDLKDPYVTYRPTYIESLWNIVKTVEDKKLLYKDYKVVPWCPRCGTGLSSHELAQGYETVKDLTVYVKFKVKAGQKIGNATVNESTYLLAWTTTPWTLPGNVALAIGKDIEYVEVQIDGASLILAKARYEALATQFKDYNSIRTCKGSDLVGLEYEPLYPYLKDSVTGTEKAKLDKAFKVYDAEFVTTTDGTGIVHIAPMYGQDDFELGTRAGLPKYHLVNDDGTFKKEAGFLAGRFVKDEAVAVDIIKDLANRPTGSLLFHKEKYEHEYPHCWRCHTPLVYFARDSWYIRMSSLRDTLVKENESINWEPTHIKEGRFGEWLREIKDWAISRERYWGTPLPVWSCDMCQERKVVGSVREVSRPSANTYHVMRHGQSENNVANRWSTLATNPHHLTEKGKEQAREGASVLRGAKIDLIIASPFVRTRETAAIAAEVIGYTGEIVIDERLSEWNAGSTELNGVAIEGYMQEYPHTIVRFEKKYPGGETYGELKKRMGDFLYDCEKKYAGKNILFVTHEGPGFMLQAAAKGLSPEETIRYRGNGEFLGNGQIMKLEFTLIPHNARHELDLHRPYIDEVTFACACGGTMRRAKEVMDVWFDSGAMPFAQDHYPFAEGDFDPKGGIFKKARGYPADFISEAIDQTRGWFYTLHAIGALMGFGKAFKNVICLGHILDAQGKKMSKSIGNVVSPWEMMDLYGADALRLWMYSVNQPGDSKNFDQKTVDEVVKKVFNLAGNVLSFYKMYAGEQGTVSQKIVSSHPLDKWILAKLDELTLSVTRGLDAYVFLEPTRAIREFIGDLSQWYVRRSRDRFKGDDAEDKAFALATTRQVLLGLSKLMAPFAPFFAEHIYGEVGGQLQSVHLESWPSAGVPDVALITQMELVRIIASRGLEARMAAKVNVRQPLQTLHFGTPEGSPELGPDMLAIVRDEVNVKEVVYAPTLALATAGASGPVVELDTVITPELKEEGELRELLRTIQDMRKEAGLKVGDMAHATLLASSKTLVDKYAHAIQKATGISRISFGDVASVTKA